MKWFVWYVQMVLVGVIGAVYFPTAPSGLIILFGVLAGTLVPLKEDHR